MNLTGKTQGASRQDITRKAKEVAATYFGTECVAVKLSEEECETDIITDGTFTETTYAEATHTFTARWSATESHRFEQPTYGFAKCVYCKVQKP